MIIINIMSNNISNRTHFCPSVELFVDYDIMAPGNIPCKICKTKTSNDSGYCSRHYIGPSQSKDSAPNPTPAPTPGHSSVIADRKKKKFWYCCYCE